MRFTKSYPDGGGRELYYRKMANKSILEVLGEISDDKGSMLDL